MKKDRVINSIETAFLKRVHKDKNIRNAYLKIYSKENGLNMHLAKGNTKTNNVHISQPNYMASVGKLFTAVIIGILHDQGKLSFDDKITAYLDDSLTDKLHVYKGIDYTDTLEIKHLLKQTSGLADNFWELLDHLMKNPEQPMSPRESILWVKNNTTPHFSPGNGFSYSDTNYHLLGLIIEQITDGPFHKALTTYIFTPLGMKHSYMLHYSKPLESSQYPTANFYYQDVKLNDISGYGKLDYSGGGIVATFDDLLTFMSALTNHKLVNKETLDTMLNDCAKFGLGIDYGYGIWKIKTIPLLMPKALNAWGVAGATGAFMFYHPQTKTYIIGNFNDFSYQSKGLRYMLLNVVKHLSKL